MRKISEKVVEAQVIKYTRSWMSHQKNYKLRIIKYDDKILYDKKTQGKIWQKKN